MSRKPMASDLGQVYEQLLGKVIRLTAGHQAKVEERSKGLVPTHALDEPSAQRKLSAMEFEPPEESKALHLSVSQLVS